MARKYPTKDLTVLWHPEKCVHAGICVKLLPQVYNPREKPWVKPDLASNEELINQIKQCPSGALAYEITDSKE